MKLVSVSASVAHIVFLIFLSGIYNPGFSQTTASDNVSQFTIEAPLFETPRKIWVYLPKTYSHSAKKYPVLYLQDAQNIFDDSTSFSGEWRVDEILDSLKTEIIVVGIEHGGEKRIEELTPFPHPEYMGGKAVAYLDFIILTLIPEIQKRYKVKSGPQNIFIGGSSLGGLFAYYSLLKKPDIFGKGLIFSPSFWYSEEIFNLTDTTDIEDIKETKIFIRAGENESETMVPLMFKMRQQLIDKGYNTCNMNVQAIPEGKHNEKLWSSQFAGAVLWLMKD